MAAKAAVVNPPKVSRKPAVTQNGTQTEMSELGKRLMAIRAKAIEEGLELLDWDQIEAMTDEARRRDLSDE